MKRSAVVGNQTEDTYGLCCQVFCCCSSVAEHWLQIVRAHGCPVVIAQWQSTGYTSQVFWVQFPVAATLFSILPQDI